MVKRYGVVVEHKAEKELIWESHPMTYADACAKMREIIGNNNIIRCAVFSMNYVSGNENLIPKESEF